MNFHWYTDTDAIIFIPGNTLVLKGAINKNGDDWIVGIYPFMNLSGAVLFQKKQKVSSKDEAITWFEDNIQLSID